jgi:hypothetical protein
MALSNRPLIDANGVVVNVIVHDDSLPPEAQPILPDGHTLGVEGGRIGDTWNGTAYVTPPPPPPPPPPTVTYTKAQLRTLNLNKFNTKQAAGTSVDIGGGVTALVATNSDGKADVLALNLSLMQAQVAGTAGSWSTTWYQSTGNITINATQLGTISTALQTFTIALLAAWQAGETGIEAETITTPDQLNALSWPT